MDNNPFPATPLRSGIMSLNLAKSYAIPQSNLSYPITGTMRTGSRFRSSAKGRRIQTPFDSGVGGGYGGRYVNDSGPITTQQTSDAVIQTRGAIFFNMVTGMDDVFNRDYYTSPWGESNLRGDACTVHQYAILAHIPEHQVAITAVKLMQPRVSASANGFTTATAVDPPQTVGEAYIRVCDINANLKCAGVARDNRSFERLSKIELADIPGQDQPLAANSERCVAGAVAGTFSVTSFHPNSAHKKMIPMASAHSRAIIRVPRPEFDPEIHADIKWDPNYFTDQCGMFDKMIGLGVAPFALTTTSKAIEEDIEDAFTCANLILKDCLACWRSQSEPMFVRGTAFPKQFKDLLSVETETGYEFSINWRNCYNRIAGDAAKPLNAIEEQLRDLFAAYQSGGLSSKIKHARESCLTACAIALTAGTSVERTPTLTDSIIHDFKISHGLRLSMYNRYRGDFMCMSASKKKSEITGYVTL